MSELHPAICKNCSGRIELDTSKETIRCPYCETEYAVSDLLQDSDSVRIEKIRANTELEIHAKNLEHMDKENEKAEKEADLKRFKKSKFCKVLIIFAVVMALLSISAFSSGHIFAGIVGLFAVAGFVVSLLLGMQIIPEKRRNFRLVPAIAAFVLIVPFLATFGTDDNTEPPEDGASAVVEETETAKAQETETTANASSLQVGIRPEFKKAMDAYSAWMDDYIAFMQKYKSNPGDSALMADYFSWMEKYQKMVADFEAWENGTVNDAEAMYYAKVQLDVSQKLMAIS